jgi:tetratricopeptide (TPR) repeat protein
MKKYRASMLGIDTDKVATLIEAHMFETKSFYSERAIRRFINKIGPDLIYKLIDLRIADKKGGAYPENLKGTLKLKNKISEEIAKKPAFGPKDLALKGHDLMKMGFPEGPQLGRILKDLVERVLDEPEENTREKLIAYVEAHFQKGETDDLQKKQKERSEKAKRLEAKGDKLKTKNKPKDALKAYRKSREADPENPAIYDKLIEIKSTLEDSWSEEDFSESMEWTMKKQELENPDLKEVYESLSPEYTQIKQLIGQMLQTPPEIRDPLIERIKSFGGKAVRPLLDILLSIDAMARGMGPPLSKDAPEPPPPSGGTSA